MSHPALESFRQSLIAAQLGPEPALRRLALRRYNEACAAIAGLAALEQVRLHQRLFDMLPSDWPLWVERYCRVRPCTRLNGPLAA